MVQTINTLYFAEARGLFVGVGCRYEIILKFFDKNIRWFQKSAAQFNYLIIRPIIYSGVIFIWLGGLIYKQPE